MTNPNIRGKDAIWTLLDSMDNHPDAIEFVFTSLVLSLTDCRIETFVQDFCRETQVHVPEFHSDLGGSENE